MHMSYNLDGGETHAEENSLPWDKRIYKQTGLYAVLLVCRALVHTYTWILRLCRVARGRERTGVRRETELWRKCV